ncbi:MAG: methylenetetrahydrofolate reductase [NAD(P)H] [Chloroflexi bacterium]|nr:methylenetetrahydrofolate reductase [NAD(P)H] [Chloroflexota bacterium]
MKIRDILAQQGKSISFEFFPPKTLEDEDKLFHTVVELESFRPSFVSVTYGAGGGTKNTTRHIIERIKRGTSLTPMPHLTCVGQSNEELVEILRDYRDLGIENILALRGDLPPGVTCDVAKNGTCHAVDVVQLAASFDAFSIGVAAYPEGHIEAPNLDVDLRYFKQRIEAGADFAITQMFFDNSLLYRFIEQVERAGISVPVIAGIMPITDIEKIKRFSKMCGTTLPTDLVRRMEGASSPAEAKAIGIDFATRQCADLWEHGVRYFHFYTLNRSEAVAAILCNLAFGESREFYYSGELGLQQNLQVACRR